MAELKPCRKCGVLPEKETMVHDLDYRKGGYPIIIGRFKCPVCGDGPSFGQSYSVTYGWDKNIEVWNRRVSDG